MSDIVDDRQSLGISNLRSDDRPAMISDVKRDNFLGAVSKRDLPSDFDGSSPSRCQTMLWLVGLLAKE